MTSSIEYAFDRYLRYDELVGWVDQLAAANSDLVTMAYGRRLTVSPVGSTLWRVAIRATKHRSKGSLT